MKTEKEIEDKIKQIEKNYDHVLTGTLATIDINAPRALMQLNSETQLAILNWVLGKEYKSKLKGKN